MVDAVGSADFFGVVEGGGAVAVGDYEDVFGWEDFEGCGEGGADYVGGFVLRWGLEGGLASVLNGGSCMSLLLLTHGISSAVLVVSEVCAA